MVLDCCKVADIVISRLQQKKVIIQRYDAITTNSIYLKFDYGLANTLRIGNHKGKKDYAYRYLIRLDLQGYTSYQRNGYIVHQFGADQIEQCLKLIIKKRNMRISSYGKDNYITYMRINKLKVGKERGFWSAARLLT